MKTRLATVPAPIWVALATVACLAPFCGSAFKVDDTLFLWAARHIREHPADFYGFTVNWVSTPTPMIKAFDNPPLTSYFIAFVSLLAGWSEWALHAAFLLPAVGAALGVYFLAGNYCRQPVIAALAAVLTPVFLISATTVMCDVMLMAFWVWCLWLFESGVKENRAAFFWAAGLLAGLAMLTKYSGLALCPLLVAYGVVRQRRAGWWLVAPVLPLLFLGAYQFYTCKLYGRGLFSIAAESASDYRLVIHKGRLETAAEGLVFLGGCFLPGLFYAPWLRLRRAGWPALGALVVGAFLLFVIETYRSLICRADGTFMTGLFLQAEVFILAGVLMLALAALDSWERRDRSSLLLAFWVAGVFVFAAGVNWTVNGRSLLPLAPAAGILLARRMEAKRGGDFAKNARPLLLPAAAAAVLSLLLVRADCNFADLNRVAALELGTRHGPPGETLWFEGHWGFQYYLEDLGARPVDIKHPIFTPGDVIIIPNHAANSAPVDAKSVAPLGVLERAAGWRLATYNPSVGASFYAASMGPLPFAFGWNDADRFEIVRVKTSTGN